MAAPSYSFMCQSLGYENLSNRVASLYDAWLKTDGIWQMEKDELIEIMRILDLDDIIKTVLMDAWDIFHADPLLSHLLSWMQYVLLIGAHPSDWLIPKAPIIHHDQVSSSVFQLMTILSLIPPARRDHQRRGIDEKHALFNLNHLKGYIKNYMIKHHEVGIENFGWTTYLASLGLIHLSALHFMHHVYHDRFYVFRHIKTDQQIVLASDHIRIRRDGQFDGVNSVNDEWFESCYHEDDHAYHGYRVNPMGSFTNEYLSLPKLEYKMVLKPGDAVIDFHIPTKGDYSIEGLKETFFMAKSFFQTHYPEYGYRFFWCTSWLYSPQITAILGEHSRIVDVANQGYRLPATPGAQSLYAFVFGTDHPHFETFEPKTSLQRRVIDYVSSGHTINAGCWIYAIDDLHRFGHRPYLSNGDFSLHHDIITRSQS